MDSFWTLAAQHLGNQWLGALVVLYLIGKSGLVTHLWHWRWQQSDDRHSERKLLSGDEQAFRDDQRGFIAELRAAYVELDERCRAERAACTAEIERHAREIARLRGGLAAVLDWASAMRTSLRASGHDMPPPPAFALEAGD